MLNFFFEFYSNRFFPQTLNQQFIFECLMKQVMIQQWTSGSCDFLQYFHVTWLLINSVSERLLKRQRSCRLKRQEHKFYILKRYLAVQKHRGRSGFVRTLNQYEYFVGKSVMDLTLHIHCACMHGKLEKCVHRSSQQRQREQHLCQSQKFFIFIGFLMSFRFVSLFFFVAKIL